MAYTYQYTFQKLSFDQNKKGAFLSKPIGEKIPGIRAVIWKNNEVWTEATAFIAEHALTKHAMGGPLDVLEGYAGSLRAYADFLENWKGRKDKQEKLKWECIPSDQFERPTYLFRGHLIELVNSGAIKRSTAARHISAIRQFYQWALSYDLILEGAEPYRTKKKKIKYVDNTGLTRTKNLITSDLSIKTRKVTTCELEDGVYPITIEQTDSLLKHACGKVSQEFLLILKLGFFTGMRIGTIMGLTQTALRRHFESRELPGWYSIEVGPNVNIPTKGNVNRPRFSRHTSASLGTAAHTLQATTGY